MPLVQCTDNHVRTVFEMTIKSSERDIGFISQSIDADFGEPLSIKDAVAAPMMS